MAENSNPMPEEMASGSTGPFVNLVLAVLATWYGTRFPEVPSGIVLDGEFLRLGYATMINFQETHNLEPTGNFDLPTRAKFEELFGFTAEELAALSPGTTKFVDSHGEQSYWNNVPERKSGGLY